MLDERAASRCVSLRPDFLVASVSLSSFNQLEQIQKQVGFSLSGYTKRSLTCWQSNVSGAEAGEGGGHTGQGELE